jgi:curved DNA-binding protein CbpA
MEFKDYCAILDLPITASKSDILAAYRKLCKKWHPDKNPGANTTEKMQEIIAARLILMDDEARRKYDMEYARIYRNSVNTTYGTNSKENKRTNESEINYDDPELEKWIRNAHKQSVEICKRLILELREQFKVGLAGSLIGMKNFFLGRKIFE